MLKWQQAGFKGEIHTQRPGPSQVSLDVLTIPMAPSRDQLNVVHLLEPQ